LIDRLIDIDIVYLIEYNVNLHLALLF